LRVDSSRVPYDGGAGNTRLNASTAGPRSWT
jgi:hypothetical protein